MDELEEVGRTADALRTDIESLFVRGLATSGAGERRGLVARTEEWERVGAHFVASKLRVAIRAAEADARDAPHALLSAYTSLHAFERVLSLEVAARAWTRFLAEQEPDAETESAAGSDEGAPPVAEAAAKNAPALDDPKGAAALAAELAKVVEDLVRTGLTSATSATRTKLDAAFKEASKRKLLRLGASLRYVNEEVGRFLADDGTFTARRYAFFLHRSWLLAKGLGVAITKGDARLTGLLAAGVGSAPEPVKGPLEVVTLGISKRVAASACGFDFRLRVVNAKDAALVGKSLVWSVVFARKAGVPAEAYLHLPQPQKFTPKIFRDANVVVVNGCAILGDGRGGGRLMLGQTSTVTVGKPFADWGAHRSWDRRGALARVKAHAPSPLDLAVEMVEEVVFDAWDLRDLGPTSATVVCGGLTTSVTFPAGDEGKDLRERLEAAAKKKKNRPALFGTVHYEAGQLVLQPLSLLGSPGAPANPGNPGKAGHAVSAVAAAPEHLTLSNENINLSALLGSLDIGG
jgi:hypothetical protein